MAGTRSLMAGLALIACIASRDAAATLITFDPDDFATGTAVSNASAFVSLSTFRNYHDTAFAPTYSQVFASNCRGSSTDCATTGAKVFGDGFGGIDTWGAFGGGIGSAVDCFRSLGQGATPNCSDGFNVMLMSFTESTDFVEISGAFWAQDDTHLYGFDDSFNLIGNMTRVRDFSQCMGADATTDYCRVTTSLSADTRGIRYVIAGGWSNGTSLDNLNFSVPEPGTLALLGLGLAGIAAARRKPIRTAK